MPDRANGFSVSTKIPADHPSLPGHFPGRPLAPAVLLLDCAARALHTHDSNLRITSIHAAKFLIPVLPEQPIDIQITVDAVRRRARFDLRVEGRSAAHGELGFVRA